MKLLAKPYYEKAIISQCSQFLKYGYFPRLKTETPSSLRIFPHFIELKPDLTKTLRPKN